MSLIETSGAAFQPVAPLSTKPRASAATIAAQVAASMARELPMMWDLPDVGIWKGVPLALAAGGPSLARTLDEMFSMLVVACGSSHDFLVDHELVPDYCVVCDPDEISAGFLRHSNKYTTYLIASCCHPAVFDALTGCQVYLWHSAGMCDGDRDRMIAGGCTVTLKAINIAILLGYSDLHFFGLDSSFDETGDHSYEHAFGPRDVIDIRVNGTGRVFKTSPEFLAQAQHFQEMLREEGHLFTATVHGDGMIAEMQKVGHDFQRYEREKYERMWAQPAYRKHSIGEQCVDMAIAELGITPVDTLLHIHDGVVDFGCGSGRAVKKFLDRGVPAKGVDFVNALDPDIDILFGLYDLTGDIGITPGADDWGYCTDVMEHIPPPFVDAVLRNIATICRRGAFFTIACYDDAMGALIGEKLHLSVNPPEWWADKLAEFWPLVRFRADNTDGLPRVFATVFHEETK